LEDLDRLRGGMRGGGVDWIDMAKDGDKWRAFVITAVNLWVPQIREISGPAAGRAS
jgi:hypothetical protein